MDNGIDTQLFQSLKHIASTNLKTVTSIQETWTLILKHRIIKTINSNTVNLITESFNYIDLVRVSSDALTSLQYQIDQLYNTFIANDLVHVDLLISSILLCSYDLDRMSDKHPFKDIEKNIESLIHQVEVPTICFSHDEQQVILNNLSQWKKNVAKAGIPRDTLLAYRRFIFLCTNAPLVYLHTTAQVTGFKTLLDQLWIIAL